MNLSIINILPNIHQKDLHLLPTPPQPSRQRCHTKRTQPLRQILPPPQPQLLRFQILRPRPQRPIILHLMHIHKPRLLQIPHIMRDLRPGFLHFNRRGDDQFVPLLDRGVLEGRIVAAHLEIDVLHFEPAAGAQRREGVPEDGGYVAEAGRHHAAVDVIEGVGEGPVFFVFGVADFEMEVWGDVLGLGWAEICPDNFC